MGETKTRDKKYHTLGELFPFDDSFYNNLTQLLEMDKDNHFVELMLSALLYNPNELFYTLITIFNTLYEINHIQQRTDLSVSAKNEKIKMQEYIFNQSTIEFLENKVMPLLQRAFQANEEQLANEASATQLSLNKLDLYDNNSVSVTVEPITSTVNNTN